MLCKDKKNGYTTQVDDKIQISIQHFTQQGCIT